MIRPLRFLLLATLAAALLAPAADAAPRMWVGFQDDPSLRWSSQRVDNLDFAEEANATVVRTTVYWSRIAPRRPQSAANPFDAAYRFSDLDEMVRGAQRRGIEVLLTIWGTPRWAGPAQNRLPRRLADLTAFSRAVAARYSGRYAGYPHVRFYSVWNEPNREIFLAPQYDPRGRSLAPALYARLYRASYAGLKAGNRLARVAVGETAAHGRDKRLGRRGTQETHSPGKFAELLAKARPRIRFDAWAHHPYPTRPRMRPTQRVRFPNVSLATLPTFGKALDRWFGRRNVPLWITEYGHETRPQDRSGVTYAAQSSYAAQALAIARKNARVQMFVWFILRDHVTTPWDSGLVTASGAKKPAFRRFAAIARGLDARNSVVEVKGRDPLVRISALPISYFSSPGSAVGVNWEVWQNGFLLGRGAPTVALGRDGWIAVRPEFTSEPGRVYTLRVWAEDVNGNEVARTLVLRGRTTPIR